MAFMAMGLSMEAQSAYDDLSLSAVSDQQEVDAGQTITVTVTATWEGADGGKYIIREAAFPKLHAFEIISSRSSGEGAPSPRGQRFERKLIYTLCAKEPGEAETGPIEVRYYRPEFKHEKVSSADEKKDTTAPLVRELPSIAVKVNPRVSSALIPVLVLGCAGIVVLFFAIRLLRT